MSSPDLSVGISTPMRIVPAAFGADQRASFSTRSTSATNAVGPPPSCNRRAARARLVHRRDGERLHFHPRRRRFLAASLSVVTV
jgi:hypothetical protein